MRCLCVQYSMLNFLRRYVLLILAVKKRNSHTNDHGYDSLKGNSLSFSTLFSYTKSPLSRHFKSPIKYKAATEKNIEDICFFYSFSNILNCYRSYFS